MAFLTVFTAPKSFINEHINIIQRNAIKSWMHLGSEVEVLLMGEEDGMAEIAEEYQIRHFPEVKCSEQGTPKINSMILLATEVPGSSILPVPGGSESRAELRTYEL